MPSMTLCPFGSTPSFQSIESDASAGTPKQRYSARNHRVMAQRTETQSRYPCELCKDLFLREELMERRRTYPRNPEDPVSGLPSYWKLCVDCEVMVREEEWLRMSQAQKEMSGPDYTQSWRVAQELEIPGQCQVATTSIMPQTWGMGHPDFHRAFGEPEMLTRPCVDCGRVTGSFCDWCWAHDRVPNEEWAARQKTPLCSKCDRGYGCCHFCRGQSWCTQPRWS